MTYYRLNDIMKTLVAATLSYRDSEEAEKQPKPIVMLKSKIKKPKTIPGPMLIFLIKDSTIRLTVAEILSISKKASLLYIIELL